MAPGAHSIEFDDYVETLYAPCYAKSGRPGIALGLYFRITLIDYLEKPARSDRFPTRYRVALSRQPIVAPLPWGCARRAPPPAHASMTHIPQRLPLDVRQAVFEKIPCCTSAHQLISAEMGVDSITLEANAAMRPLVHETPLKTTPNTSSG